LIAGDVVLVGDVMTLVLVEEGGGDVRNPRVFVVVDEVNVDADVSGVLVVVATVRVIEGEADAD